MPQDRLPLAALADKYNPRDPESIERYAKRLIGRTLREALQEDKGRQPSPGKGSFGRDLRPSTSVCRPRARALRLRAGRPGVKSSPLKRIGKGSSSCPRNASRCP